MLKSRKDMIKIIESDLGIISSDYNKKVFKELNVITEKHIERGTDRSSMVLGERDLFFINETNKLIKDLISELVKIQTNLNIKFRKSELIESKTIIINFSNYLINHYSSVRESYLKMMNNERMDNMIDNTRKNIDNTVNSLINVLILKRKEGKEKPEVIYQRKAYYIAVLALIISIISVVISSIKK